MCGTGGQRKRSIAGIRILRLHQIDGTLAHDLYVKLLYMGICVLLVDSGGCVRICHQTEIYSDIAQGLFRRLELGTVLMLRKTG